MATTGRRGWSRALLLSGPLLLLGGLMTWLLSAIAHIDGYAWDDESLVPVDGRPHAVAVSEGSDVFLWTVETEALVTCRVVDKQGRLGVEDADREFRRQGSGPGDWVSTAVFEPRHGIVDVTCRSEQASEGAVAVEDRPWLPPPLALFGSPSPVALVLAVLGLLLTLAGPLIARSTATRPPERTSAG